METRQIHNAADYMLLLAQEDANVAREILAEAKSTGNQWKEKASADFLAFLEAEERLIHLYTKAKINQPEYAVLLEQRRPFLKESYDEAELKWERLQSFKSL